jgi:hypothetical protein
MGPTRDPNIPTETERPYTPMPTPTPLVPTIAALQYQLKEWTPYRADVVISYLEYYPETLSDYEHGYHDSGYYGSFYYAALLQKESLLRFPVAQQVLEWRWGLAYNLAQTGYEELGLSAGDVYAGLIIDALNSGEVEVDNYSQWFVEREPRLEFRSIDLPIPSQYSTSKLLEISRDQWCGAYLWLLGDQAGFDIYPLKNDTDFGFSSASGISFDLADLTGDGMPEVVTRHEHVHGIGPSFTDVRIDVFDISSVPPQLLSLEPPIPSTGYLDWSVHDDGRGGFNFEIAVHKWFNCPGVNTYNYHWDGYSLRLSDITVPITDEFFQDPSCVTAIEYDLIQESEVDFANARELLVEWLQALPSTIENSSFLTDNWPEYRDEIRYQVGILMASWDEVDIARQIMQDIVDNPSSPDSQWVNHAQAFLDHVSQPSDLANACAGSIPCYPYLNMQTLAQYSRSVSPDDPLNYLRLAGVNVHAGGLLGLDGEGSLNYWFAVKDSEDDNPNIYLLVDSQGEYFVNNLWNTSTGLAGSETFNFNQHPSFDGMPYYYLEYDGDRSDFIFYREPSSNGFVLTYPLYQIRDTVDEVEGELLNGGDPIELGSRLLGLQYPGLFPCTEDTYMCWFAPRYLYRLGLTYELSGNEAQAVETYLTLWQDYPQSPYAYIAYAKLEPVP